MTKVHLLKNILVCLLSLEAKPNYDGGGGVLTPNSSTMANPLKEREAL